MKSFSRLLFVLLLITTTAFSAAPHDTIIWITRNFPPTFINEGKFSGQGSTQLETEMIQKLLPEYVHLTLEANIDRMTMMMKNGKKVCRGALIKTPAREEFMYMSIPHNFYPTVRLYFKKDNYHKFEKYIHSDKISLEDIFSDRTLKAGIESGRSYGTDIDPIIKKHLQQKNILSRKFSDTEGTIAMLLHNRFDYMIEFPFSIGYYLKQQEISQNSLKSMQITEMIDPFLLGSYGVPKNEWGKLLINKINNALIELRGTPDYRQTMERWLETEIIPDYRNGYNSIFLHTKMKSN